MRDQKHIGNKEKLIIKMNQIQSRKIFENINGKYLNALTIKQHCHKSKKFQNSK